MRFLKIPVSHKASAEVDDEDDEQRSRQIIAMGILKYLREV